MEPNYFESQYPPDSMRDEISKALSFIKTGSSCQILGLPGVGKSEMMRLLAYNRKVRELHLGEAQKQYHFVYMDFLEVKDRSLLDVNKFILISLAYSLNERGLMEEYNIVNDILKEAVVFQDELILFQALKKTVDYLCLTKGLTIVFLFDRFGQYTQDVSDQFFDNLKILRNRAKFKFSCIFSLPRPMDVLTDPATIAEFYEFLVGNTVFFGLYQKIVQDFRLLLIEQLIDKKNETLKKQCIELTGGHSKLLKLSYEASLSHESKIQDIQSFLLGLRQVQGVLKELEGYFTSQEKTFLKEVAAREIKEIPEDMQFLMLIGIIRDGKITIPLFSAYLSDLKVDNEKLSYDEQRNEILKGDTEITDNFTPSEFRLLRHLLINEGKVVEKDDLIAAVWKDTVTREGVTDQALDQLIYRLRKKIEEDPNNPKHIETVKGRGVKYIG